jgi:hypothetical protein
MLSFLDGNTSYTTSFTAQALSTSLGGLTVTVMDPKVEWETAATKWATSRRRLMFESEVTTGCVPMCENPK